MKKLLLLLLCALPALSLCACSSEYATVYTVETSDGPLTVDNEHNTISDGENTYTYNGGYGTAGYDLEITYPDGSTWSEASTDGISHTISFSDDYVHGTYTDGDAIDEMEKPASKPAAFGYRHIIHCLAPLGLVSELWLAL